MKKFIRQLSNNTIFRDFDENDWRELESLSLLKKKSFDKGEVLFSMGENTNEIGIIIEGSVIIESNDILGNSTILNKLETGDVFAETYAITGTPMMVDIVAAQSFFACTEDHPQSSLYFHAEKPYLVQPHILHFAKDNPRAACDLFFGAGHAHRKYVL